MTAQAIRGLVSCGVTFLLVLALIAVVAYVVRKK